MMRIFIKNVIMRQLERMMNIFWKILGLDLFFKYFNGNLIIVIKVVMLNNRKLQNVMKN